jgi:chromosome segregation ATPase
MNSVTRKNLTAKRAAVIKQLEVLTADAETAGVAMSRAAAGWEPVAARFAAARNGRLHGGMPNMTTEEMALRNAHQVAADRVASIEGRLVDAREVLAEMDEKLGAPDAARKAAEAVSEAAARVGKAKVRRDKCAGLLAEKQARLDGLMTQREAERTEQAAQRVEALLDGRATSVELMSPPRNHSDLMDLKPLVEALRTKLEALDAELAEAQAALDALQFDVHHAAYTEASAEVEQLTMALAEKFNEVLTHRRKLGWGFEPAPDVAAALHRLEAEA